MISDWHYFRYPQFLWSRDIYAIIRKIDNLEKRIIIDAPCGDGIISYWLSKKLPNVRFELYDISEGEIETARRLIPAADVKCKNIFELETSKRSGDIWLFINSLYCLPDADNLLERMADRMQYIIGVFPDITHRNYRCFCRQNPDFKNHSEMDMEGTISFFKKHRYSLLYSKFATYIPFRCYNLRGKEKIFNLMDFFLLERAPVHTGLAYSRDHKEI